MMGTRLLLLSGVFLATLCLANPAPQVLADEHAQFQGSAPILAAGERGRERRQVGARRPGVFALLFQLIAETRNDTRSAYNQISRVVERSFETPTPAPNATTPTTEEGVTTTEAPARISREEFLRLFRRNLRGLSRLFNREVETAIQDSNRSSSKARKDFMEALRPFLAT